MEKNNNKNKTEDLILSLTKDLSRPSESFEWPRRYLLYWMLSFSICGIVAIVLALLWPDRAFLPSDPLSLRFLLNSSLWLALFAVTARLSFTISYPLAHVRRWQTMALVVLGLLAATILSAPGIQYFAADLQSQLAWSQGPCGVYIAFTGLICGSALLLSLRRALPQGRAKAGAWTLLAAGSLSSFFMQLLCRHETPAHVLLWHVLPILLLATLGLGLGAKVLKKSSLPL